MRIAQIAPLMESCPPAGYGGTERVVSYLTEALVAMGHEVTLFATGDSRTSAELVPGSADALRLRPGFVDPYAYLTIQLGQLARRTHEFDICHFHIDYPHFPLFQNDPDRTLTTLHGRLDLDFLPDVFRAYPQMPMVSISDAQRAPLPGAGWVGTVYHGLPSDLYSPGRGDGGYLAFVGRISPEKGPDRAIAIARALGRPIRIAAKVDRADQAYFDSAIRHLLDDPLVTFVGEVDDGQKNALVGGAEALLFPIEWPEPFGLVMIEAMAVGTPVVAFAHGSVPEVIEDGLTGVVAGSVDEAVAAFPRVAALDRGAIRRRFEERFSVPAMAGAYVALYEARVQARRAAAGQRLEDA